MGKDLGFNERLVTYLYSLEVQDVIQKGREDELQDIQEFYNIPQDKAASIIESSAKRYLSQLFNLAFRGAKRYDEKDTLMWLKEIVKYVQFISEDNRVECDGNLFSEKDKERLLSYFENSFMNNDKLSDGTPEMSESKITEMSDALRRIIYLTDDYVAPLSGIQGLLGGMTDLNEIMLSDPSANRKRWAWG
jgi:hypothetical protein